MPYKQSTGRFTYRGLTLYYICSANIILHIATLFSLDLARPYRLSIYRAPQGLSALPFKMCGITMYDSPTCGHSWRSMSQPCGPLSDLLSCPRREIYQTLIAPPDSCPQCNLAFADCETIEMVQGPWGCNQMIRSQIGGNYAIPGSWGNAPLLMNNFSPGFGVGMGLGMASNMSLVPSNRAMIPVNSCNYNNGFNYTGYNYDHRLTGPYGPRPAICNGPAICSRSGYIDDGRIMLLDDGYDCDDYGYDCGDYGGRRRRHHTSKTKYMHRHTSKPAADCAVM
jgi:hypothetical protein